jgi:glycosyltransferase involved in cell wall biosynthesis
LNYKVAIIQNRLQRGGRLQVMIYMIKVINAEGIIPEILTLSSRISENDIKSNYYSRNLQFKINEISKDFKMPFEWNILYFNHVVNRYLDKYDLIINNNNTSFLLNKSLNILSYVHFPRKARNLDTKKSIHFPSGPDKSIWDYKSDLFGIAAKLYRKDKLIKNDLIVANSEFTKSKILDFYNIPSKNIEVVYPPVETEGILNKKQKNQVVSLGRFAPDKRQLEQIMIAQKLQKYHFYIIGFVNSKDYYEFCKDYIISNNLNNITLVADATKKEMLEILSTSSYFIHSIRNEPFGITTVQAIHNSVIPIVHNSGGQKEIVSCNELRYDDKKDAVKVFNYLSQISDYKREYYIRTLKENVKAFSIDNYERKLKKLINKKIDALA